MGFGMGAKWKAEIEVMNAELDLHASLATCDKKRNKLAKLEQAAVDLQHKIYLQKRDVESSEREIAGREMILDAKKCQLRSIAERRNEKEGKTGGVATIGMKTEAGIDAQPNYYASYTNSNDEEAGDDS